ncbi:hypothetical protein [Aquitalea pelogenes]|uniref:hypothetical protein n=1 Tax=Aquitalea pelogenes TaxID=1293573 RepID=UPI0035B36B06
MMRLAKWNLFIPVLALAELLFAQALQLPLTVVSGVLVLLLKLKDGYGMLPYTLSSFLSYLLICIGVLFVFAKYNVLPLVRQPAREQRYRRGHWLLASMNVLVVLAFGMPMLLSTLLHDQNRMMLMWYSSQVYPIAPLVWAIGLYMVWSSRAVPPGAALPGDPE